MMQAACPSSNPTVLVGLCPCLHHDDLDSWCGQANVGHTESASGMLGVAKLLCSLRRSHAAPNAQLSVLAKHVATTWQSAPHSCMAPTQLAAVPARPASGTVNSFGLGGTIASILLHVAEGVLGRLRSPGSFAYRRRSFPWRRPMRAQVARRGAISGMVLCEQPAFTTTLARGEVEMQVRATGLNFKDVLNVLGELPTRHLTPPGADCAGIVASVGELGHGVQRGDELFGIAPGCLHYFVR